MKRHGYWWPRRRIDGKEILGEKCENEREAAKLSDQLIITYERKHKVRLSRAKLNFGRNKVNETKNSRVF